MGLKSQISKRSPSLPMILFVISMFLFSGPYCHPSGPGSHHYRRKIPSSRPGRKRFSSWTWEQQGWAAFLEEECVKRSMENVQPLSDGLAGSDFKICVRYWHGFYNGYPLHCPKGHYWIHAGETPRTPGWWAAEFWREGFPHQSLLVCISFDWTQPHGVSRASR